MRRKDISTRQDIELIVKTFYDKVRTDNFLNQSFDETDWEKHVLLMTNFWDNVLFYSAEFSGNPMVRHQEAHEKLPMSKEQFHRWLIVFNETVDASHIGKNTTLLKERAKKISAILQDKLFGYE